MHIGWTVLLFLSKWEIWLICIVSLQEGCFKQTIGHTVELRGKLFAHMFFWLFFICCELKTLISLTEFFSWFQTFAIFWMLFAFFWAILQCLNCICWHFGTLCLFHRHRQVGMKNWRWNRHSVPKHCHIKFRRWGITQKKAYNLQLTEFSLHVHSSSLAAPVQTVIICLHVFLSLSWSFLLGIGCWLSCSCIVPLWWSQNFHTCKKYRIFITLKTSGHLALVGDQDRHFKPIKLGWMGSVCVVKLVEDASEIADWVLWLQL